MRERGVRGRVVVLVVAAVMMLTGCAEAGGTGPTDPGGGPLNPKGIPAQYVPLLNKASGQYCQAITAPALAGQDRQESGWNTNAVNPKSKAAGLAQFMPGTWQTWGRDADKNGTNSPTDPGDSIDAQARFMCALVGQLGAALKSGVVTGDVLDLAWAGYNAGPGNVLKFGGVPPFPETQNYVRRVRGFMVGYEQSDGSGGGGTFRNPLAGQQYTLSSGFGPRPSPCAGCSSWHYGQDMAVPVGTPVKAACSGTVIASSNPLGGMGLATVIACGGGIRTYYGHQSQTRVSPGTRVRVGQLIGLSGNTGNSSGPHLHFEIHDHSPAGGGWYAGSPIDPVPFMKAHGAPL